MNRFYILVGIICLFLITIAILLFLIYKNAKKGNKWEKIIEVTSTGLIFALITSLFFQFIIVPVLTPKPGITALCITDIFKLPEEIPSTIIIIKNRGDSSANSLVFSIDHPKIKNSSKKISCNFMSSTEKISCNIKSYYSNESNFIGLGEDSKMTIESIEQTVITCDYLAQEGGMFIECNENFGDFISVTISSKEIPKEEQKLRCGGI